MVNLWKSCCCGTARARKNQAELSLDPCELFVCHCIIHQGSLCTHSLTLNTVMKVVVSTINFIKSRGLNIPRLGSYWVIWSQNMEIWEVRWLSRANTRVAVWFGLLDLNVKLQGPNQHLSFLFSNLKSFEARLNLWQVQLEHFYGPFLG